MSQFAQIKCKRITKKTRMGHETGMKHICLKASVQGQMCNLMQSMSLKSGDLS